MPPRRTSHASSGAGDASTSSASSGAASKARSRPNSAASSTRPAPSSRMVKREPVSEEEEEDEKEGGEDVNEDVSSDEIAVAPSRSKAVSRAGPSNRKATAVSTTTTQSRRKTTSETAQASRANASKGKKKAIVESSDDDLSTSEDEVVVSRLVKREPQEPSVSSSQSPSNTSRETGQEDGTSSDSEDADDMAIERGASSRKQRVAPVKQEQHDSATSEDEAEEEDNPVPGTISVSPQLSSLERRGAEDASSSSSRASTPAPGTPLAMAADAPQVVTEEQPDDALIHADTKQTQPKIDVMIPLIEEGPKKRLVIHKIVLVDFKSYAGRQEIGPFHKVSVTHCQLVVLLKSPSIHLCSPFRPLLDRMVAANPILSMPCYSCSGSKPRRCGKER